MSWNRSERKKTGERRKKVFHSSFSILHFTFYIVPLALVCGAVLWWATAASNGDAHDRGKARPSRIAEAATNRTSAARLVRAKGVGLTDGKSRAAKRPQVVERGPTNKVDLTRNVKPPTVLGCNYYECVSGGRPLFARPIFTNSAENIIGGLLSARPGERFVPVELGEDFDNDFAESLKSPTLTTEDDTPESAIVKEAVAKAKEMIAEGMAAGQKPSEVVMSMRDEMNRIADYRDMLQEDFDSLKETATAERIMAYLKEANMLLDEFGAEHLDLPEDEIEEINRRLAGSNQKEKVHE